MVADNLGTHVHTLRRTLAAASLDSILPRLMAASSIRAPLLSKITLVYGVIPSLTIVGTVRKSWSTSLQTSSRVETAVAICSISSSWHATPALCWDILTRTCAILLYLLVWISKRSNKNIKVPYNSSLAIPRLRKHEIPCTSPNCITE